MDEDKYPWCGQCNRGTRHHDTPDGPRRCTCHPLAGKRLSQFRTCPRCLALIRDWDREDCENHHPIGPAARNPKE
jgi:hypothetical protein